MTRLVTFVQNRDAAGLERVLQDDRTGVNHRHNGMSPLLWACQLRAPLIVKLLLSAGADPNLPDDEGETPLHVAAFEGTMETVHLLLQHGANPDAATEDGKTPLMNSAKAGHGLIAAQLLAAGADAQAVDNAGRTALHWALAGSHDEPAIISDLIKAGTDPHARDIAGDTAFDYTLGREKARSAAALRRALPG